MDEALVLYKGWSSLKQYMPTKPVRRGLKVWIRADAVSSYVSQFQVHVGKDGSAEMGLGAQVIKKLTRTYVKKKYHVFCDFFLSVNLSHSDGVIGVYATGTIRADILSVYGRTASQSQHVVHTVNQHL
uniref:PiggyBac transposable element-derived protein domain-containing protein n=1 Tax=Amphimedon queenslandica TaxID=400682 RepID=A0A1X7UDC3_AMPQE